LYNLYFQTGQLKLTCTLLFFLLLQSFVDAQQSNYTAFTVNDGLPSNHIYQCVEDDHGFLWIATDAGVARFDGKHFQVFTTEHGLPDNEVLNIVKEKNGTIWINCFRQDPAYFDFVKNRFISSKEDTILKVSGTSNMHLFALSTGGVQYHNEYGSYVFKREKVLARYSNLNIQGILIKENDDGSDIRWGAAFGNKKQSRIFLYKNTRYIDSLSVDVLGNPGSFSFFSVNDDRFYHYQRNGNTCIIYSGFPNNPLRCKKDTLRIPEPFFTVGFSNTSFFFLGNSGKLYVYNKATLVPEHIVGGPYLPNSFYEDRKGNIWISTIDKGLLVYRKKQIASITMPPGYARTNFISLAKNQQILLAGNYYGEVAEVKANNVIIHSVIKKTPSRQRKIVVNGNNIYTISEDGIYLNYVKKLSVWSGKTAIMYDDSTMLIGNYAGIDVLNTNTVNITKKLRYKRVTALVKSEQGLVYIGSTDGLHSYDPVKDTFRSLSYISPLLTDRIAALCTTNDGIVWVATSGKGLVAIADNKVLANISMSDGIISNTCRSMSNGANNQIWIGTAQGISVLYYKLIKNKLTFSIRNISVNDGLISNEINDLLFSNDTMFIATGNGLSLMPANFTMPGFNIPIKLIRMNINQQDTIITDLYKLNYQQQNIQMQFAAIELNGHFRNFQYTIDKRAEWIDLPGRTLSLQLNSGLHTIHVRAIDVNGNISKEKLSIQFDIAVPFWKSFWFWIIIAVMAQLLIIYLVNRRQKKKKEARLAKELAVVQTASLEQQAFTSLMNPHFMFNALNSIQHYINVQDRRNANRYLSDFASLIRKNFEAAHQSFVTLEEELENIKLYLRLEQMRFSNRFNYNINIDIRIDIDQWMVPTMMMQPLLENSLLHGLMPSSIKGELLINIEEKNNGLVIMITDNGIGIENSKNNPSADNHKSRAMELINKRITALNRFVQHPIEFVSAPAYNHPDNPGHRITIFIPGQLYEAWRKVQST
jgi:ligand-binding sensor domain-containing protein/two-component sensor histidine kinase